MLNCLKIVLDISFFDMTKEGEYSLSPETSVIYCNGCFADIIDNTNDDLLQKGTFHADLFITDVPEESLIRFLIL